MIHSTPPKNFSPRAEVAACYIEHDGQILLLKRTHNVKYPGAWGPPGGKIDDGESFTPAAIRETFEETGIELDSSKIKFLEKIYVQHKTHGITYYIHHYNIDSKPSIILAPDEHVDYCWMSPKKALELDLIEDEDLCIKRFFEL